MTATPQPDADNVRLLSIVIPTRNEHDNLDELFDRLDGVTQTLIDRFVLEFVVTDNCSSDGTFEELLVRANRDPRIRAFQFASDIGYQRSILTGYLLARGEAVIQLDADLQDPPELIPTLVEQWESGAQVVFGIRRARTGEPRRFQFVRRVFYRLINRLSDAELPHDAGDFRLIDRSVVEVLRSSPDASPYLRGTIAALGFRQVGIPYERDARLKGDTKFSLPRMASLAVDGIVSQSLRPLRLVSITAAIVALLTALGAATYLIGRFAFGQVWPAGFATLALIQLLGITLNAAFLGIIGAYIGRIFRQTRMPPVAIIYRSSELFAPKLLGTNLVLSLRDLEGTGLTNDDVRRDI